MRILLAQNSLYYPAHGGGDKSNRLLLEALSDRGHACQVVARVHTSFGAEEHRRYLGELAQRSVSGVSFEDGVVRFPHNGVEVHAVTSHPNFRGYFARRIAAFEPEVILVSTDDPAQVLLETALGPNSARVVYLTRTTLALPFGPECAFPSQEKTELLRQTDGVVGVSRYVADYIRKWSGIQTLTLPISLLEPGPCASLGRFDNELVTMVNPCAVKGIAIFLALAGKMPEVQFAAVPVWGTTAEDLAALNRRPNVRVLEAVDNIDDILKRTRVLLAPSLWAEARSRIVVEAMLRGIPVLASNVGGIPEAKMGVDYLLPVRQINRYEPRVDEQMVPVAEVPEQDIGPWQKALAEVVSDRERYERLAGDSREAALAYANGLGIEPFESYLIRAVESPRNPRRAGAEARKAARATSPVETLSPEKRALLALRLKKKTVAPPAQNLWFPTIEEHTGGRLRLFCFPYAGGGTSVFRGWAEKLPPGVAVCPARLPGRESRTAEPPFDRIEALVEAVAGALHPHLDKSFAFAGHSMGAMIGFELARHLRRHDLPAPVALFVSGARAPQFRRDHSPPPEPTEEEFLDELRHLEGAPRQLLENEELLRFILPAIRADSALCRVYAYQPELPLDCPIHAYAGADDPRLPREVIEAWREQTTSSFKLRTLPGGHFFPHTAEAEFLKALGEDLLNIMSALP